MVITENAFHVCLILPCLHNYPEYNVSVFITNQMTADPGGNVNIEYHDNNIIIVDFLLYMCFVRSATMR